MDERRMEKRNKGREETPAVDQRVLNQQQLHPTRQSSSCCSESFLMSVHLRSESLKDFLFVSLISQFYCLTAQIIT